MRNIENGRNEEHQKEWKTAEINKKMELNRKKEECQIEWKTAGGVKKMRENGNLGNNKRKRKN